MLQPRANPTISWQKKRRRRSGPQRLKERPTYRWDLRRLFVYCSRPLSATIVVIHLRI